MLCSPVISNLPVHSIGAGNGEILVEAGSFIYHSTSIRSKEMIS